MADVGTPTLRGALPLLPGVTADAVLSPCGTYRYTLTRDWAPTPAGRGHVLWLMLNPSIAAADVDDRTIRKCQKFARFWGYDGITAANLFALRATSPDDLLTHPSPVGDANDDILATQLSSARVGLVVAAWGVHGRFCRRDADVLSIAARADRSLHVVQLTKDGHPGHPLYVKDTTTPALWMDARG